MRYHDLCVIRQHVYTTALYHLQLFDDFNVRIKPWQEHVMYVRKNRVRFFQLDFVDRENHPIET